MSKDSHRTDAAPTGPTATPPNQQTHNPRFAHQAGKMPPSTTVRPVYPLDPESRKRTAAHSHAKNPEYAASSTVRPATSPYQRNALDQYSRGNYHATTKKRRRFPKVALISIIIVACVVAAGGVGWGLVANGMTTHPEKNEAVKTAAALVQQYDYDGAIDTLTNYATTYNDDSLAETIQEYEEERAALVPVDINKVTHVFYHSLVYDPELAFAHPEDELTAGFAQWMTTVDEFIAINQQMYDNGYVLVGLDDLYTKITNPDGTTSFAPQAIMLPPDKKAYVLSLDDLSYYHSYDNRGIASKMILDKNGEVTCEYTKPDGTTITGDFDVVPLLNKFIEKHPDAAYKNARGTIALTGYNGIFGYRTDPLYNSGNPDDLGYDQIEWLAEHPDFNYEQECAEAKELVETLKSQGWTMASHTWGHLNIQEISLDGLKRDTDRWFNSVLPLIGPTNIIIFAHGADMSPTGRYDDSNEKYTYLKERGFDVFCIVDGSKPYTLEIHDDYVHQGRRNLDGYRLYEDFNIQDPEKRLTKDLFNVETAIDPRRPLDANLYKLG